MRSSNDIASFYQSAGCGPATSRLVRTSSPCIGSGFVSMDSVPCPVAILSSSLTACFAK